MPLVSQWPLQEDSGSTAHDVAGSNDGTNNGATVGANGILGTTAYGFDGTDDDVEVPHDSSLSISSPFTISAWVNVDGGISGIDYIISKNATDQPNYSFWVDDSGMLSFMVYDGSFTQSQASYPADEWVFVVGVYDGSEIIIYQNAVEEERASCGTPHTNTNPVYIGRRGGGNYFDGRIADVRVYDHALTPAEVQYLYSVGQRATAVSEVRSL
jgi:hypothetical protein